MFSIVRQRAEERASDLAMAWAIYTPQREVGGELAEEEERLEWRRGQTVVVAAAAALPLT